MPDQIIYLHRPRKGDICVALASIFWQMRPSNLIQHGFAGVKTVAWRDATELEVQEFKAAARVSWCRYNQWSNLIADERKLAGDAWAEDLKEIVLPLIPEFATGELQLNES
jgi:hypothetical protein